MLIQSATITESTSRTLKAANGYIFPLPTEKKQQTECKLTTRNAYST